MLMCPNDQTTLLMTDRRGVEIEYCPTCRGVWLDRGELDKIIDRSWDEDAAAPEPRSFDDDRRFAGGRGDDEPRSFDDDRRFSDRRDDDRPDEDRRYGPGRGRRRKKESFLADLFDF